MQRRRGWRPRWAWAWMMTWTWISQSLSSHQHSRSSRSRSRAQASSLQQVRAAHLPLLQHAATAQVAVRIWLLLLHISRSCHRVYITAGLVMHSLCDQQRLCAVTGEAARHNEAINSLLASPGPMTRRRASLLAAEQKALVEEMQDKWGLPMGDDDTLQMQMAAAPGELANAALLDHHRVASVVPVLTALAAQHLSQFLLGLSRIPCPHGCNHTHSCLLCTWPDTGLLGATPTNWHPPVCAEPKSRGRRSSMPAVGSPMSRRRSSARNPGASTQEMKWGFAPGLDDTMQMNLTDKGAQRGSGLLLAFNRCCVVVARMSDELMSDEPTRHTGVHCMDVGCRLPPVDSDHTATCLPCSQA